MVNNIANSQTQNAPPPARPSALQTCSSRARWRAASPACAPCSATPDAIPEVGPLRSGRDQFLQLLMPWQAPLLPRWREHLLHPVYQCVRLLRPEHRRQELLQHATHPHVAHRDSRGRNVAYEHTEFTSGKRDPTGRCQRRHRPAYPYETPSSTLPTTAPTQPTRFRVPPRPNHHHRPLGELRPAFSYNRWGHIYKMQMYNRSKKAYENTVDELTGKQLPLTTAGLLADIAAYAGDSHDVQQVDYVAGGEAYLFTRGGVQVGRWEKPPPNPAQALHQRRGDDPQPGQDLFGHGGRRRVAQL